MSIRRIQLKIYHAETQKDYDALMVELERQGYEWTRGVSTTIGLHYWERRKYYTCVVVRKGRTLENYTLREVARIYPTVPITKYKAKVNEMKFTKENVIKLTNEWIEHKIGGSLDLQDAIMNLDDDTPEKVVVPEFVAEWIESFTDITSSYSILEAFMCSYNKIVLPSELYNYYDNNENGARDKVISAILSGYEVENEPLYHVATKDGKLMLFKYENVVSVTPAPVVMTIKDYGHKPYYQLTETEIKNYDERYIPFMVPVDEVNND